jgi:glycosyltransferase involved in cell wall biosynthesis
MKLKILHVITTIERGGAENQLLILVRNQIFLGNQVSVCYLKGKPELSEEFEALGVKIYHPNKVFLFEFLKLGNVLKKDFDIVHTHLPRAELLVALSNLIFQGNNLLVTSRHNSESFFPRAPKAFSSWLSRLCLKAFKRVVFISEAVEFFVRKESEVPNSLPSEVIYYGYDDKYLQKLEVDAASNDKSRPLLFVGRLTEQKNIPFLLSAFREYLNHNPSSELHIYGTGELDHALRLSTSDLVSKVHWKGKVKNIQQIMGKYKCLILPSHYEGFGLVLLEAMQNQLPVLASNISAIPEVLGMKHPGLFNLSNHEELTYLMQKMDDEIFRRDCLDFQSWRLKLFEPKNMALRIQKLYESFYF